MTEPLRIIISGGGTGGHIFPAVSIANAIREISPSAEILFVGAEGRMEMQRVPAAGYEIKGLPVAGFDRKHLWRNVSVLIKLMKSPPPRAENRERISAAGGGWGGGLRQWPNPRRGTENGHPHAPAGAKLLCGRDQQTPGQESQAHLRSL